MVFNNNLLLGAAGQGGGYEIDQSIRFNSADNATLSRSFGTPTDQNKFTYSYWIKSSKQQNGSGLGTNITGGTTFSAMTFNGGNMAFYDYTSLSANIDIRTTFTSPIGKFRDYSAWYHGMFVYDSDQATDSNRIKFYINGVRFPPTDIVGPLGGSPIWPGLGANSKFNASGTTHSISDLVNGKIDGYMAEIYFIDGQALDPTSFGEYNDDGVWTPKAYDNSYGNNGFYITGETASDLGEDFSGNGNDFTSSGLATTDQMLDTPTNNFCMLNENDKATQVTLADGNLRYQLSSNSYTAVRGTFGVSSGKWYWEMNAVSGMGVNTAYMGIATNASNLQAANAPTDGTTYTYISYTGNKAYTSNTSYGTAWNTNGRVIGVALDLDAGKIWWSRDGVWQASGDPSAGTGEAFSGITGTWHPYVVFNDTSPNFLFNFGQSAFTYTPPTDFNALNTANLPTPSIKDGSKYFNTLLYEGNGGGQRVGQFQPITETYTVPNSVIFNFSDAAHLLRTPSSASNRRTWTWSLWVKRAGLGNPGGPNQVHQLFGVGAGSCLRFTPTDELRLESPAGDHTFITSQVFKDTSSWYHIVLAFDSTQATDTDRRKLYVNGSQVTDFSYTTFTGLAQNDEWDINSTSQHQIAKSNLADYFGGYLAELNFIDGQALGPDNFGQLDASTNKWIPKDASGLTFGTNGFYLDMETAPGTGSGAGTDSSGNGNNWTESGLTASDQVTDSPTDNYSVLNPLSNGTGADPSDGNLKFATTSAATGTMIATLPVSSGKWYCEVTVTTGSANSALGIRSVTQSSVTTNTLGSQTLDYAYRGNGQKFNSNTKASYGSAYTTGAVVGIALDLDGGTIKFLNDNSDQGIAYSGISGTFVFAVGDDNASSAFAGTFNFGQSAFTYTPPAGFNTLSTDNLPLSNGDLSAFVWIKNRDAADNHMLFDAVRGATKDIHSNTTDVEVTNANTLTRFLKNGFEVSNDVQVNTSGESYVAWQWMNDSLTASSNTDGSITSSVLANTTSGFSIAKWTHTTASNYTVGHGLGAVPKMILVKTTDQGTNWGVYHSDITVGNRLLLNSTSAQIAGYWGANSWTSSTFSIGSARDADGSTMVGYCFAEVEGFSKFGSYIGNSSTDGPFVYTGFKPAFIMTKRSDSTSDWTIEDTTRSTFNLVHNALFPNLNIAEDTTGDRMDILSNGFKLRTTQQPNIGTLIYMAFAENPFGGAGVAPATGR
jgi:hypothetical protein